MFPISDSWCCSIVFTLDGNQASKCAAHTVFTAHTERNKKALVRAQYIISANAVFTDADPFRKKFKGSCPDCPWHHACFGAISIYRPKVVM